MARRAKHGESEDNRDRWLISYADFITLLFAFFVVMYSLSTLNTGKYRVFSESLNTAFKGGPPAPATKEEELIKMLVAKRNERIAEQVRKQHEAMQSMAKDVSTVLTPLINTGQVNVTQSSKGLKININASALFNQGDAKLLGEGAEALTQVAKVLRDGTQAVEVEGYTDDVPIKNPQFPSNWELSSARACSVVRLFIDQGLAPSRLSAAGFADNRPVQPNTTSEGRALNRRVSVMVLAPEEKTELPPP
jgi:chemotaxis protein MotB